MNLFTDQNKDKRPGLANFYTKMHCLQSQFALGEHFILNDQKRYGKMPRSADAKNLLI